MTVDAHAGREVTCKEYSILKGTKDRTEERCRARGAVAAQNNILKI